MTDLERLADVSERYMVSVRALFEIDPNTKKCFAEGSPTKDQETYERFMVFNNCGHALSKLLETIGDQSS